MKTKDTMSSRSSPRLGMKTGCGGGELERVAVGDGELTAARNEDWLHGSQSVGVEFLVDGSMF